LELSTVDNTVWVSSTRDFSGNGGGGVWQSDEAGDNFTKKYQVDTEFDPGRTEIEVTSNNSIWIISSTQDSNKKYSYDLLVEMSVLTQFLFLYVF
jgi:hypothetical protein